MNKVKDLLYDKNDVLVAMLILCIAALVILSRVNHIMAFPERMISGSGSGGSSVHVSGPENPGDGLYISDNHDASQDDEDSDETSYGGEDSDYDPAPSDGEPSEAHSLYIASGETVPSVARNLVTLGLFPSEQDVIAALEAHNATTRVQAGNFIIPANSTRDEVIRIITTPV